MYKYPKSPAEAALILDAAAGDWYNRVWIYRFMSGDIDGDILGQLYGTYHKGFTFLFGREPTNEELVDNIFGQSMDNQTWEALIFMRVRADAVANDKN
jgi:hypothetical protein